MCRSLSRWDSRSWELLWGSSRSTVGHAIGEQRPEGCFGGGGNSRMYGFTWKQMIHLINRCVFFKIYFLKIIFVDLGIPWWHLLLGICSCALRIAIGHVLHRSLYVYVLWTGFSQDSFLVCFLLWALFFCVLYYIVKGILAETLVFGTRGEQECWAVYFRWRIHLQTFGLFSFNSSV